MLKYTIIQHEFRRKHNLSLNDYVFCDMIHKLSNRRKSKFPGWCYMSRENMGKELGISKRSIITIQNKMIEKGMIEKDDITNFLKSTFLWDEHQFTIGEETSPLNYKIGEETSPHAGEETSPYNSTIDNSNLNNSKLYIREENFKNEVKKYSNLYTSDLIEEFILYWTEPNKSKTKLKFELQQTWETSRRLKSWFNRSNKKSSYKQNDLFNQPQKQHQTVIEIKDEEIR